MKTTFLSKCRDYIKEHSWRTAGAFATAAVLVGAPMAARAQDRQDDHGSARPTTQDNTKGAARTASDEYTPYEPTYAEKRFHGLWVPYHFANYKNLFGIRTSKDFSDRGMGYDSYNSVSAEMLLRLYRTGKTSALYLVLGPYRQTSLTVSSSNDKDKLSLAKQIESYQAGLGYVAYDAIAIELVGEKGMLMAG